MQYRVLGRTGIKVSALGFGCMRLPTLGAPDRIDEAAAAKLLRNAIEAGVNYIDTAWFYHSAVSMAAGESEPFVGRALSGEWRERIHLATKLPQQLVKTREDMDDFLARQLERLQTEHIDFYLVHGLNGESWNRMRDLGVREFLDTARRRGFIRHAAFSFHGAKEDFPRIIDEYDGWAFGQIQYNYVDTEYQAGIAGLRYASGKGLGVVVMEPLKGGRLANKLPPEMKAVFDGLPEGGSPAEWALRFVWNEPGVSLLLSGMNDAAQLEENLRIAESAGPGELDPDSLEVRQGDDAADPPAVLAPDQRDGRAKSDGHPLPQRQETSGRRAQRPAQIVIARKHPPRSTPATKDLKLDRRSWKTPPVERRGGHVDNPVGLEPLGYVVMTGDGHEAAPHASAADRLGNGRRGDPRHVAVHHAGEFVEGEKRKGEGGRGKGEGGRGRGERRTP